MIFIISLNFAHFQIIIRKYVILKYRNKNWFLIFECLKSQNITPQHIFSVSVMSSMSGKNKREKEKESTKPKKTKQKKTLTTHAKCYHGNILN